MIEILFEFFVEKFKIGIYFLHIAHSSPYYYILKPNEEFTREQYRRQDYTVLSQLFEERRPRRTGEWE